MSDDCGCGKSLKITDKRKVENKLIKDKIKKQLFGK
jgi:hypothetical protein